MIVFRVRIKIRIREEVIRVSLKELNVFWSD